VSKKGQSWGMAIARKDRGLYHLERTYCNLARIPAIKPALLRCMKNLLEHQLSPVCLDCYLRL
jgi:hypothetical protein